ncbi:hypothetical protein CLOBOL_04595 [Enterocloster bolteae ATCC BAA-613]|uniref:Uncharacterized protein n=1 Tax=Enterocloster bolteae (strain ATCC BAA-613 / DSM 15670 / CCUG 46953 / JCM 12243 / WAL 16351) TaxID=411902 RepID=A8RWI4_ENTBW|nr:hypothetical protein CLOBOL_04595 [Enterocloster bolteae ATCC BAA-613]
MRQQAAGRGNRCGNQGTMLYFYKRIAFIKNRNSEDILNEKCAYYFR